MEITEARVKLVKSGPDKLQAFCSLTIDNSFVIRDLKVIEGSRGYFVAMPSRKLTDRCPRCDGKNHLRARFCNDCGARLPEDRAEKDEMGRARLHVDIAHPINSACRDLIQDKVLKAFHNEMESVKQASRSFSYREEEDTVSNDDVNTDLSAGLNPQESESLREEKSSDDSFGKGLF